MRHGAATLVKIVARCRYFVLRVKVSLRLGTAHQIICLVPIREVAFEADLVDFVCSATDRRLKLISHSAKTDPALLDCTLTLQH